MNIQFDNVNMNARTGPNSFAVRLAKQLIIDGHNVQFDSAGADVSLVFIERSGKPLSNKVVQRLDGIWFKPSEYHTKNISIRNLYNTANAVVFQSQFDHDMIFHHWDLPFAGSKHVIMNGIDLTPVKQLTIEPLIRLRNEYDIIYTCSANWHRQKRLKENVECFFNLQQQRPDLKSCLLILGSNPDYAVNNPHVFYAGSQSYDVCQQIFAASNWFIHLAWLDHCPNVVVEAISQGTPVICSDSGGTKEIVRNYGVIVKEERDYKFELTNYDEPPKIDVSKITLPNKNQLGQVPNVDIKECAKKYVEVFESVLNEKLQS